MPELPVVRYNLAHHDQTIAMCQVFQEREPTHAAPDDLLYLPASNFCCVSAIVEGAIASREKRSARPGATFPVCGGLLGDGCFQLRAGGSENFADRDGALTDGREFAAVDG